MDTKSTLEIIAIVLSGLGFCAMILNWGLSRILVDRKDSAIHGEQLKNISRRLDDHDRRFDRLEDDFRNLRDTI